ncbi:hypothetical protein [Chitiniphilus eburneus]|uniref:Uncharacterized protein n=1 Tax=Chitiniphilus eburneus TaxID=2571148 RepID=A0A4U0PU93_9NEIS|nr:hypothetical protein [Chitiniphilus eburneus]TJZ72026.1 hypothetical protein FAZ21_12915 [Chitiniphilus eburneus]
MLYCTFTFDDEPTAGYLSAWGGHHRKRGHVAIYDQRSGDIVARYGLEERKENDRELELIHRRAIAQFRRDRRATAPERYIDLDWRVNPWAGDIIHI